MVHPDEDDFFHYYEAITGKVVKWYQAKSSNKVNVPGNSDNLNAASD